MRNLKKILALVLALMMTVSLMVTASAADLKPDAAIKPEYQTAVDVLSALDVIQGDNGKYSPQGTITRAEFAVMLYRITTGQTGDASEYADYAYFNDVPAGKWYSGAAYYVGSNGLMEGSSNNFSPYREITGHEVLVSLLRAIGYGKAGEFSGSNWAVNAAVRAGRVGITDTLKNEVLSRPATRQMVAELMFQTLTKGEIVIYRPNSGSYDREENQDGVTLGDLYYRLHELGEPGRGGDNQPAKKYANVDKNIEKVTDEFGRPTGTTWVAKDGEVVVGAGAGNLVASFNAATTEADIFAAVGANGIQGLYDKFIVMDEIWQDGKLVGVAKENTKTDYVPSTDTTAYPQLDSGVNESITIAKNATTQNTAGSGNGTIVEIYATAQANHYIMVAINEYVDTISTVTAATAGADRSVTLSSKGLSYTTDEFAKGDTVLYTIANGKVQSMTAAETVTGTITKIKQPSDNTVFYTYTIDGVERRISEKAESVTTNLGKSFTWYVDNCGNLIKDATVAPATVYYGYLLQYSANTGDDADLLGNGAENAGEKFKFVDSTGEVVTLDGAYKTDSNGAITQFVASNIGKEETGKNLSKLDTAWDKETKNILFSYELNASGKITKVAAATTAGEDEITVTKGTAAIKENKYGTDKTVYFLVTGTGKYAVYVGYANVADTKGTNASWFVNEKAGTVDAIVLTVKSVDVTSTISYVYFAGMDVTKDLSSDDPIYTYTNVYVDGVKGSLSFAEELKDDNAGSVYTFTTNTKTGLSTLGEESVVDQGAEGKEITSIQSGYFAYNDNSTKLVYTDSSTIYYQIDKANKTMTVADGLPALSTNKSYKVNWLYNDKGDASNQAADVVIFSVD